MRRNVVFEKSRPWRVEDDQVQDLHLGPDRGAAIGEYAQPESSEYSDSYYGPGRTGRGRSARSGPRAGGTTRRPPPVHSMNRIGTNHFSSGELDPGERSWADLGVSSVRAGESGVTDARGPSYRGLAYRGLGPKGYRRSDEKLREIVCERLTDDPAIDASDIDVEVKDGEIKLTGAVSDRRAKWYVEDIVEACSGTAEIDNRLRTKAGGDRLDPRKPL